MKVEARALGRNHAVLPDLAVPPPEGLGADGITLRELIAHVVRAEVTSFRMREEDRRLVRFLSAREIAEGAAAGRVEMGGREAGAALDATLDDETVDEEAAVATALQGFEDGLYLVLVDGSRPERLDDRVALGADSRLTFLRLTFLAGG